MKNFSIHLLALFSALFFAGCSGLILCEHCSQKFGPDWEQVIMDKRQEMSRLLKSGDSAAVVKLADAYKYKGEGELSLFSYNELFKIYAYVNDYKRAFPYFVLEYKRLEAIIPSPWGQELENTLFDYLRFCETNTNDSLSAFLDDNRALGIKDSEYLENRNFLLTQISKSALTAYEKDLFEFFIDYNFFYANKWDSQYDDQYLLLAKNLNRLLIEYPEGFATDLSIDGQTLKEYMQTSHNRIRFWDGDKKMKRELKKDIIEKGADLQLTFDLLFGPSLYMGDFGDEFEENGETGFGLKLQWKKWTYGTFIDVVGVTFKNDKIFGNDTLPATAHYHFNSMDLSVGYVAWDSRHFRLEPFAGVGFWNGFFIDSLDDKRYHKYVHDGWGDLHVFAGLNFGYDFFDFASFSVLRNFLNFQYKIDFLNQDLHYTKLNGIRHTFMIGCRFVFFDTDIASR